MGKKRNGEKRERRGKMRAGLREREEREGKKREKEKGKVILQSWERENKSNYQFINSKFFFFNPLVFMVLGIKKI